MWSQDFKTMKDMERVSIMAVVVAAAVLVSSGSAGAGQERGFGEGSGPLRVMFWNLENFFDFIDGGTGESDKEFSSIGPRRWTKKRFYRKCHAVAKTILWAAEGTRTGDGGGAGLPDVVRMAEV